MEQSSHPHPDNSGWEPGDPPNPTPTGAWDAGASAASTVELEPGWAAVRALMHVGSDDLLALMLRPSFRPVGDLDLVPIVLCPHCQDGGLRTAGSVRTRRGRELVRACDTCGKVETASYPPRQIQ